MVRYTGRRVPCGPFANDIGCCRIEGRERCDHFRLFDMQNEVEKIEKIEKIEKRENREESERIFKLED